MTQTPVSKPRNTRQAGSGRPGARAQPADPGQLDAGPAAEPEPKPRSRQRAAAQPSKTKPQPSRRPRTAASSHQTTTRTADPASTEPAGTKPASTRLKRSTEPASTKPKRGTEPASTKPKRSTEPASTKPQPSRRPRAAASARQATSRTADPASTEPASTEPASTKRVNTKPKRSTAATSKSRRTAAAKVADTTPPEVLPEPEPDLDLEDPDLEDVDPDLADDAIEVRRHRRLVSLPVVLGVVTVALGGLAAWFAVEANSLTGTAAASNSALTDNVATTQIIGQATSAVNAIFSYNYADPGRPGVAAKRDLTGAAVSQYRRLFRAVQADAAKSPQLVLTTAVTSAGVEMLSGNNARVLVFSDQVLSSSGAKAQSYDAMVALNLVRRHGTWKIDSIDTFSSQG